MSSEQLLRNFTATNLTQGQKQLLWLSDLERPEGGRHATTDLYINLCAFFIFIPLILLIVDCYKTWKFINAVKDVKRGQPLDPKTEAKYVGMVHAHARDRSKYYASLFSRLLFGSVMILISLVTGLLIVSFSSIFDPNQFGDAVVLVVPRYSLGSVNKPNPNATIGHHLPPICDVKNTFDPSSFTDAPIDALLGRGQRCSPLVRANIIQKGQLDATNLINHSYVRIRCEKDRSVSFKYGASLQECHDKSIVTYRASSSVSFLDDISADEDAATETKRENANDTATLGCLTSMSKPNGSPDDETASIIQIHPDVALVVSCFYDTEEAEKRFKKIDAEFFATGGGHQVQTVAAEKIPEKASYRATREQDSSEGRSDVVPIVVNNNQDLVWDHHTGGPHSEWKESTLPIGLEVTTTASSAADSAFPANRTRVSISDVYLRSEDEKGNFGASTDISSSRRPAIVGRAAGDGGGACCGYRFPQTHDLTEDGPPNTTNRSFLYDLSSHVANSTWRVKDIRRTDFDVGHMVRNVAQEYGTEDKFSITFWVKLWAATSTFHGSQGVVFAVMDDVESATGNNTNIDETAFFHLAAAIDNLAEEGSDHGYFDAFEDHSRAPYVAFYVNARRKKLVLAMNDDNDNKSPMFIHVWDKFEDVFDDHWHHIALSFRETSGRDTMNIYIDGVTALAERGTQYTVCLPMQIKPVEETPLRSQSATTKAATTTSGGMLLVGGFFGELFALQFHDGLAVEPWHVAYFGADSMKLSETLATSRFMGLVICCLLAILVAIVALIRFKYHRKEEVEIEAILTEHPHQFSPTKCEAAKEHAEQDHNRLIAIGSVKKAMKEAAEKYRMKLQSMQPQSPTSRVVASNPLLSNITNGNSSSPQLQEEDEGSKAVKEANQRQQASSTIEEDGNDEDEPSSFSSLTPQNDDEEKREEGTSPNRKKQSVEKPRCLKKMRQKQNSGTKREAKGQEGTTQSSSHQTSTKGFTQLKAIIPAFIAMMQEQSVIVNSMTFPRLFTTSISWMYMLMLALPHIAAIFAFLALGIGCVCLFAMIGTVWVILVDESDFRHTAIRRMMAARREVHGFVVGDDVSSGGEDDDDEDVHVRERQGSVGVGGGGQLLRLAEDFRRLSMSLASMDSVQQSIDNNAEWIEEAAASPTTLNDYLPYGNEAEEESSSHDDRRHGAVVTTSSLTMPEQERRGLPAHQQSTQPTVEAPQPGSYPAPIQQGSLVPELAPIQQGSWVPELQYQPPQAATVFPQQYQQPVAYPTTPQQQQQPMVVQPNHLQQYPQQHPASITVLRQQYHMHQAQMYPTQYPQAVVGAPYPTQTSPYGGLPAPALQQPMPVTNNSMSDYGYASQPVVAAQPPGTPQYSGGYPHRPMVPQPQQQPPFLQSSQSELDHESLLNRFQAYQEEVQRRREKRQRFPTPTQLPTFFYEFTMEVAKKAHKGNASESPPVGAEESSSAVIATLHCTPSTRRYLNEALRLMYCNEEWSSWEQKKEAAAEPLKQRSMKQDVEFDESLEFKTGRSREDGTGSSVMCDVGLICSVEATEEQVEAPEHPIPGIQQRPTKVSRHIKLTSLRFVAPSPSTALPSWVPREESEQELLELVVKPSLPEAVKDHLSTCPIHRTKLIASVPEIHDKVLQEGRMAYQCMFHQDGNLACCINTSGEELLAQECSGIHTQRPAFLVCPCNDCGYAICKPCAMQTISFKDRMLAIFRTDMYRLKRRGPIGLLGLFVVIFSQLLYIPVMEAAIMILSCHHTIRCSVTCQNGIFADGSENTQYSLLFLFFSVLALLLFCFPVWLFYIIVQRKRLILRCGILDALLEKKDGNNTERQLNEEINLAQEQSGGAPVTEHSTVSSFDAAANMRRVRVQPSFFQALFFDLHPSAWDEVLSYDDSILRSFYQHATFRFMWVQPVMLFFRTLVIIPAVVAEPNSRAQIFTMMGFEALFGMFLLLSRPYNTSWLNLLLRFYVVYELIIMGLGAFHVVLMYDAPFGHGMAIPMILMTVAVLAFTIFIVYKVTIQPIINSTTEVNPLSRQVRDRRRSETE